MEGIHKVIIIGSGPAGLSAATYAARAGFRPVVVAPVFGGQLLGKGVDVENYPGVVGEHATGRGLVDLSADAVIIACGADPRWLQVAGEDEFRGRGVSSCATCDGFLFRNQDVSVIGGGDTAMEDALHLARASKHVTIIHRRDKFRASKVLADNVLKHPSISVRWNTSVDSFHGKDELTHLMLRTEGQVEKLTTAAAFVAIGHDPQTAFLQSQVEMDSAGYITLPAGTSTSVPGVFAAGDVADHTYRQAVTASGTGAMAALDAERYLNGILDM